MTFAEWLEQNPMPTLTELIERHGGYPNISDEAWNTFDGAMVDWQLNYRNRHHDAPGPWPQNGAPPP
jgi:hypothetical protein